MADGAMTLTLSDDTASRLAQTAQALGVTPDDLISQMLDAQFFDYDASPWINGDPRDDHVSNYDLSEPGRPWNAVRPELVARLERKLSEKT